MIRFLKDKLALGRLEASVMDIVWLRGESSVRDVSEQIARPLAYTTVMTTLDRLYKKGLLHRRKVERAFLYSPALTRREWEQKRAGNLLAGILASRQHSSELLISCLVDAVGAKDAALLDELERKIRIKRRELERKEGE